jgi:hypothetical protein
VPYDLVTDELDQPALGGGVFVTELVAKWAKAGGGERGISFAAADEQTTRRRTRAAPPWSAA